VSADDSGTTAARRSPMPLRCRCGFVTMASPDALKCGPRQPSSATGMWSQTCPECDAVGGYEVWGWTLAGGRRVPFDHGEDEVAAAGVVSLQVERVGRVG